MVDNGIRPYLIVRFANSVASQGKELLTPQEVSRQTVTDCDGWPVNIKFKAIFTNSFFAD